MTPTDDPSDDGPDAERTVVLGSRRRQLVLRRLRAGGGELPLDELSRGVAAAEAGVSPDAVDDDTVARVYDSLCLTHLPVLVAHDVVEHDYRGGTIRATDRTADCLAAVEGRRPPSEPSPRWFLGYLLPAMAMAAAVLAFGYGLADGSRPFVFVTLGGVAVLLLVATAQHAADG